MRIDLADDGNLAGWLQSTAESFDTSPQEVAVAFLRAAVDMLETFNRTDDPAQAWDTFFRAARSDLAGLETRLPPDACID